MSAAPARVAFITGGSSGIGPALAHELGRRGWRVALFARRGELLREHVATLARSGIDAAAEAGDVVDAGAVRAAVERTRERWGAIDLAIANAGLSFPTPAANFKLAAAEEILKVNVFGMLTLYDAVIPHMLERKSGHFAGVASIAGLRGLPGTGMYSASKAAMQSFLEAVRVELAPRGVLVTTVNPGFIRTPMTAQNRFRMPFLMEPDEAARLIVEGLLEGKREIEFPRPMSLLMRTIRLLPNAVYDRAALPYAWRKGRGGSG